MIPYGHQTISEDDIAAVVDALRSEWLTQGPRIEAFERALADYCGAKYCVVVSSGTAALHAAYAAIGLTLGDEIITSPLTFPATTNAALWQGARPVFVDVDPETGNIDPATVEAAITPRTKAIVPIDYTGRPAQLDKLKMIASAHGLTLIEDACQALGAAYRGKKIGSWSDLTVFSFHPVKTITTGEGGAVLTDDAKLYHRLKSFITHGVVKSGFENPSPGEWYFEIQELGQNYRLTDFQAALGLNQLAKTDAFVARRRELAERYRAALHDLEAIRLPSPDSEGTCSAWHLFVIRVCGNWEGRRAELFTKLRSSGIGVQVHHIPTHYHPLYRRMGYALGMAPHAEAFYEATISLPLHPNLDESVQDFIIEKLREVLVGI